MNGFDRVILEFLNRPAFHSPSLDLLAIKISTNLLLKGGVVLAAIWWLWFARPRNRFALGSLDVDSSIARTRRLIIMGFAGTFVALALARGSSVMFSSRPRPLNQSNVFQIPEGVDTGSKSFFINDSSFPSDHAALFYALATTILFVSRPVGVAMFMYVTLIIMVPRLYLLLHFPTDILAGGILGTACVILLSTIGSVTVVGRSLVQRAFGWSVTHQATFYAAMFLWSFSIAELFDSLRKLANLGPILRMLASHH
ncbi:hypothetical protein BH09PLA1_BH09PLA1_36710 [soil metagenome]